VFKLLALALVAGLIAGSVAKGRVQNIREIHLRWMPVLFVSLIMGLLPLFVDLSKPPRLALQFVSMLGVLAFLILNAQATAGGVRAGFLTITAGWALNFIVIAANGGMPLSRWAFERGPGGPITPGRGGFFKIVIAGPRSKLRFLGDVIPIKPLGQVLSIGDVILIAGIIIVIAAGMRARTRIPETVAA